MELEPGEQSIFAYFPSTNKAQQAGDELLEAGFSEIQIDRVSRHGFNADASFDNPVNQARTISGLTHFSADKESKNTLLAADPTASGYGDQDYGIAGGQSFLLTLVTGEEGVDQAVEIIKKNGGRV
jgi:hypothetical protein